MIDALTYDRPKPWGVQTIFGLQDLDKDEAEWDRWMVAQQEFFRALACGANAFVIGSTYFSDISPSVSQVDALETSRAKRTRLTGYMGSLFLDNVHEPGDESLFVRSARVPIDGLIDLEYAIDVSSLTVLVGYFGPDDIDSLFTGLDSESKTDLIADRLLDACEAIVLPADDGNVTKIFGRDSRQTQYADLYSAMLNGALNLDFISVQ